MNALYRRFVAYVETYLAERLGQVIPENAVLACCTGITDSEVKSALRLLFEDGKLRLITTGEERSYLYVP